MRLKVYFDDLPLIITDQHQDGGIDFKDVDAQQSFESLAGRSVHEGSVVWRLQSYHQWKKTIDTRFKLVQAGGGVVINKSSELLMIFRKGKWDLPKGKLDKGEDIESCALREVSEETGLEEMTIGNHLTTTYHAYYFKEKWVLKESVWFLMQTDFTGTLTPQIEEDIHECRWVKEHELSEFKKNAHASVRDVIDALVSVRPA